MTLITYPSSRDSRKSKESGVEESRRDTPIPCNNFDFSLVASVGKTVVKNFIRATEELIRYIKSEEAGKCSEWWKLKRITKYACC